ncbi:uncharacterized protein LOC144051866 isoform X2 [Vanacampus margaritifer]
MEVILRSRWIDFIGCKQLVTPCPHQMTGKLRPWGIQSGVHDRALLCTATLVRIGRCLTMAGVTGPWRLRDCKDCPMIMHGRKARTRKEVIIHYTVCLSV